MASKVGSKQQQADQEFDPKYEWQENAANFVLRLHLAGFRKEDFRVQVDGAGRLTVRGQRADGGKHVRFHKVFQLPPTGNLDDISGRFDTGVLSLTVPKKPTQQPATIDEIRKPATAKQADEATPKEEKMPTPLAKPKEELMNIKAQEKKEELINKTQEKKGELINKTQEKKGELIDKTQQKKGELTNKTQEKKGELIDKKAEQLKNEVAAKKEAAMKKAADEKRIKEEEMQAKITKAAADEKKIKAQEERKTKEQAAVDRESIAERVRRRAEEEKAKAAAAAEEAAERQKQQLSGWKERVAGELQGLRTSEWAETVVDTVKKNKEVIAAAVAAFSLGLFVSSRFCNRNN